MMTIFKEGGISEKMNVAEAKKKFSELLARTAYNGERFIINRRGKPMAALIGLDDLALLEEHKHSTEKPQSLLAAAEALAGFAKLRRNHERCLSFAARIDRACGKAGLMYLFDTDTLSNLLAKRPSARLLHRLGEVPAAAQFTSSITVGEICYGLHKSSRPDYYRERLERLVWPHVQIVPFYRPFLRCRQATNSIASGLIRDAFRPDKALSLAWGNVCGYR